MTESATRRVSPAIVTGSLSPHAGGLYHSVRIPANRMAAIGTAPIVYGLADDRWDEARTSWAVRKATAYAVRGPARFGYAPRLARDLAGADHELVHLHGLWNYPSFAAWRWRKATRRPLVIAPRGMLDPWALGNSPARKRAIALLFERDNLKGAAALHALCRSEADSMRGYGLSNPIAIIPNGVDPPPLSRLAARRVGGADGRKTLLFLGRVHPKKGLAELIDAWARLRRSAPAPFAGWRLDIAGWDDGGHLPGLRGQAATLGLTADEVRFLGGLHGEAKEQALLGASAFILPSRSEGLPIAVLEAWAYAVPAFITAECNLPEGYSTGAAFEVSRNPVEMARVLAECLGRDDALADAGDRGRRLVEQAFSWDSVVDKQLRLYEWLVHGGSRPSFVETGEG